MSHWLITGITPPIGIFTIWQFIWIGLNFLRISVSDANKKVLRKLKAKAPTQYKKGLITTYPIEFELDHKFEILGIERMLEKSKRYGLRRFGDMVFPCHPPTI